ncbi:MAG: hypothetical protein ACO3JL_10655 [Myxococcota bacterium]
MDDVSVIWLHQGFLEGDDPSWEGTSSGARFVVSFPGARFAKFAEATGIAAKKYVVHDAVKIPAVLIFELPGAPSAANDDE